MVMVQVPLARLGVPLAEFGAMLNAAGHQWHADQSSRYLGAVRESLMWVAGLRDRHPLTRQPEPAEPAAMFEAQMQAAEIVYDWPEALPGIHREWALGVLGALAWTRGAQSRPPVRTPEIHANATRPAQDVAPIMARTGDAS